ncbi:MAG: hypothetical protein NTZ42_03170 [Candidatus Gribaldobacteria bacterium]|nr:hypothetical protein [Candidatus Gribaldobacteria bacterium]
MRKIHWRAFLLLGVTLGAVFLLAPLSSQAAWYDYLTPTGLASGFVGLILKVVLGITGLLVRFANWLVTWTLGNPYNISYTRPGLRAPDNFVIEIGWTLLRDLVNMAFILGLAYIGFSTALDFGNKFKTKKTFLNLLLIALLINFTPAICGAIVDVGNILGSFFIQGADFSTLSAIFERQQSFLTRDWSSIITDGTMMLNTLMLIAFGLVSALVLIIYGVLFLARGPIIWLLVILSPAAFFCFIFEKTKKQFDQWWELFLQWALILPVILGFFLYLSMQILARTSEIMSVSGGEVSGFLNQILPYTIPVGFLAAGLFLTTSKLMGGGAKGILGLAKGAGIGLAAAAGGGVLMAGKKGLGGAKNLFQKRYGDAKKPGEEGYEDWKNESKFNKVRAKATEMGRFAFGGATAADKASWGKAGNAARFGVRALGGFATLGATYWANPARRIISGKVNASLDEGQNQGFNKKVEELKGKSTSTINNSLQNALPGLAGRQQRLAAAKAAIDSGKSLSSFSALTPEAKKQIIKDAINIMPEQMQHFKALDPMLTAEVVNSMNLSETRRKQAGLEMDNKDKEKYDGYTQERDKKDANGNVIKDASGNIEKEIVKIDALAVKIMAEVKADKMKTWSYDTAQKALDIRKNGVSLAAEFWDGKKVAQAAEEFSSKFVNKFNEEIKIRPPVNNKILERYLTTMPAQSLGFIGGEESPEIKESKARIEKINREIKNMEKTNPSSGLLQKLYLQRKEENDILEKATKTQAASQQEATKPGEQSTSGIISKTINSPETQKPTNVFSQNEASENADEKPLNIFEAIKSRKKNDDDNKK